MIRRFEVLFLNEALEFLESLSDKARRKVIYNIDKASYLNDPALFKKLDEEIWEFRTKYDNTYYRFLAFWDKREKNNVLVIATHGLMKKSLKIPTNELKKAQRVKKKYFLE